MERLGSIAHIFNDCRILARLHRFCVDSAHSGSAQGFELHFINIAAGRAVLRDKSHTDIHRHLGEFLEALLPEGIEILLRAERGDNLLRVNANVELAAVAHRPVRIFD